MKKIISAAYGLLLLSFAFFSYAFVDPNLFYLKKVYSGFAFQHRGLTTILYSFFIFSFFILHFLFLWLLKKKLLTINNIKWLIGITSFLIFSYPTMLSYDIFNYITTAKVLFFYKENPYIIMPIEFLGDPLLLFTHAANKVALYGPIWIILTSVPYLLGFGNFILTLFSLKLFIILFYIATAYLIWRLSSSAFSLVLFALNPLVIIETLVSGHNDIAMMFFALFSFFLLMRKKIFFGILFFILSIFIKYTTVLLMPVFLFMTWRIIKKKEINFEKIFYHSSLLMYIAFLLSPIREEIYPWYAIWFISFALLAPSKKILLHASTAFSFSLLFRYTPYMFTGTYASPTPFIKEIISFAPPVLVFVYHGLKKKI